MKPLSLIVCLLGLQWAVFADELAVTNSVPPAPQAGTESKEKEPAVQFELRLPPRQAERESGDKAFHDPFASETEKSKPEVKIADPLEPVNRAAFRFNDKLYFWVLKPAAKGYNKVAPQPFRASVNRFFINVKFPVRWVNHVLQGRLKGAGIETARFLLNSTLGSAGFFDPASQWKLKLQPADFDQTLSCYGAPPGPYLNWPFLGPSSVRGTVGMAGDAALTPWTYIGGPAVSLSVRPYETLNATSLRLGEYEQFKQATFDPYVAQRSAYFEHRRGSIKK